MKWLELSFELANDCSVQPYEALLSAYSSGVVVHDPRAIKAHMESGVWDAHEFASDILEKEHLKLTIYLADQDENLVSEITDKMQSLAEQQGDSLMVLPLQEIADEDWANSWKKNYEVLHFGKRTQVVPEWMSPDEPQDIVVKIDPGLAFGTGNHDTTGLCLGLLETLVEPAATVFDIGCGSGILAIAAQKLGAGKVLAYDFDPLAVRATKSNAELNGLELPAEQSDLCQAVAGKADLIIANIVTDILLKLLPQLDAHLEAEGKVLLSGIINERAEEVIAAYEKAGYVLLKRQATAEWTALVLQRS